MTKNNENSQDTPQQPTPHNTISDGVMDEVVFDDIKLTLHEEIINYETLNEEIKAAYQNGQEENTIQLAVRAAILEKQIIKNLEKYPIDAALPGTILQLINK